ncbi:MAG: isocitrate/isopropylmalate family dehydrogenase [Acidobacteriota bacterium]
MISFYDVAPSFCAPHPASPLRVVVVPGDGIGPEVVRPAVKALEVLARRFDFELRLSTRPWSAEHYLATGETLPAGAIEQLRREADGILLGALGDPRVPDHRHAEEILLGLRFGLDLYLNYRPVRLMAEELGVLKGRGPADVAFAIFRENTEGLYANVGGRLHGGGGHEVAIQEAVYTRLGVERILRAAFQQATRWGAPLCLADKANAVRHGHGLWRRVFGELAQEFPQVDARASYADAVAAEMVMAPQRFGVLVAPNLLGDVLSDLGAALAGGLGLAPSASLHPGRPGLFEPVHGSAPDIAGQGISNPSATLLSAALLLAVNGHQAAARALDQAVVEVLQFGPRTPELGGSASTEEVSAAVLERLEVTEAAGV